MKRFSLFILSVCGVLLTKNKKNLEVMFAQLTLWLPRADLIGFALKTAKGQSHREISLHIQYT